MKIVGLALLGILAGALSGLTGIGGGVIIVPALVYIFHYSVHSAQGTTLALLVPPIGAFAAWTYYKHGYVDIKSAIIIAACFAIGAIVGADIAVILPERTVRRIFAVVLLVVATEMFLT